MNYTRVLILLVVALIPSFASTARALDAIPLYAFPAPGSESWKLQQVVRPLPDGGEVFGNVTEPVIVPYLPAAPTANGAAAILLPGGALRALYIGREARDIIDRLNSEGVAVFVLRYRVLQSETPPSIPTASPPGAPRPRFPHLVIRNANANPSPDDAALQKVLDLAIEDAQQALRLVRSRAAEWHLDVHRVGLVGSSAGGGVAIGTVVRRRDGAYPDFVASLYGPSLMDVTLGADAPPLFMATEADHGPVTDGQLALFSTWKAAGGSAELHVYDLPALGLPATLWLDRFVAWLREQRIAAGPR